MAEKNFRNWVGFREEADRAPVANPVDRIRELESQLADLKSRRDITGLSREEFEILATETAMAMIKSAQATAEAEASEIVRDAGREATAVANAKIAEADSAVDAKRRDAAALTTAARREAERVISEAADNVVEYRAWLSDIIAESERLYRSQATALSAAESAIAASREKLDSAFARLTKMQQVVDNSLNEDGTVKKSAPIRVESKRTRAAIAAPKKTSKAPAKKIAPKKKPAKRK